MRVQTRILLVIMAALFVFLAFLVFTVIISSIQNDEIAREKKAQQKANIQAVLKLKTKSLVETVHDYAVGDEIVNFVNRKKESWVYDKLVYMFKFYQVDAVWVFNDAGDLLFHSNKIENFKSKGLPLDKNILSKVANTRTYLFHMQAGINVLQICGSTIHPIDDVNRLSKPRGFFFTGKLWDANYMSELGSLTNTKVHLRGIRSEYVSTVKSDFIYIYPLFDWQGNKLLSVIFVRQNQFLDRLNESTYNFLIMVIFLAFIIISLFIVAFHKNVKKPLGLITKSLDSDNISVLKELPNTFEFQKIGTLIENYYHQKQNLAKQIEENIIKTHALKESEENFRSFIEQSSDGIIIFSKDGVLIDCNSAFSSYLCSTSDVLKGKTMWELLHMYSDPQASVTLENYRHEVIEWLKSDKVLSPNNVREQTVFLPDGRVKFCLQSFFPIKTDNNFFIGSILNDITRQKKAELQVIEALEHEKSLHEMKTHFISTVSHEFRTPMTIINSNIQMVESYIENNPNAEKCFKRIYSGLKQMTSILEDVNLMNKDFAGKLHFNPVKIDLEKFCQQIIDELSGIRKDIPVSFKVSGEIGEVNCDPLLLQYIIINLLSNAQKFTITGNEVRFEVSKKDNFIIFEVEDRGIGIPEQDLPYIFEAFHRGQNVENIKGTGLGLSIVKRSVDLHGGTITVSSEVNKGTLVKVTIKNEI